MSFKGQFKLPRQNDLRIERLVVAIEKSKELRAYFFNTTKMHLACRYLGIEGLYFGSLDDVAESLEFLYFRDPEKFRQFFQYILNEIIEKKGRLVDGREVFDGFYRFLRELNVLGLDYDVVKGKVIPTVGHTKEDIQVETELEKMLDGFNPKYREMLRGAWESFLSNNPDKYRHTIISLRELTRMLIQQLAPDEKTREAKIKKILASEKEEALVESLADTIN